MNRVDDLTCSKALIQPEKETPLSGRRADGTSVGGVMLRNIITKRQFVKQKSSKI